MERHLWKNHAMENHMVGSYLIGGPQGGEFYSNGKSDTTLLNTQY